MRVLFCSCVIITNKSKVLITQRPSGKFMEGFWEFPGGKVKNFEQFNAAAVREINEELGVQIEIKNLQFLMNIFYQYPVKSPVQTHYRPEIQPNHLHNKKKSHLHLLPQNKIQLIFR